MATASAPHYTARIPVHLFVDGARTVIAPGEALPGSVSPVDITELLNMGAITDTVAEAAAAKAQAKEQAAAAAEFEAAKKATKDWKRFTDADAAAAAAAQADAATPPAAT